VIVLFRAFELWRDCVHRRERCLCTCARRCMAGAHRRRCSVAPGAVTALANAGAEPWGALLCVGIRNRAGRGGLLRICAQSKALWGVHGVGWLSYVLRREPFGLD
jgi:hypothetical protein